MSRPQRIEFEDAYYHVMNRGVGRRDIFDDDTEREQFLTIIKEAHRQFGIEIHAYCLMSNHYHLLIKTPRGNLGRAMRHINGVFTQRLNRAKDTDGPLFRGRYKAIVVDSDAYLLHLSTYIHLKYATDIGWASKQTQFIYNQVKKIQQVDPSYQPRYIVPKYRN